ncbi:MAG: GDSL-type esterase/lipase family protein [Saprospiraceae bacterium]|nr:GDSL-type esterase/lipase family protein [Saprospiraceae bacterium]
MRKNLLFISLLVNLLFILGCALALHRLGGWHYAWYRFQHDEAGLYHHRQQLFGQLPAQPGAIIFLGDSQTEQCEWRELLGPNLPILNRGIVGDHVDGVAGRLDEVLRHKPKQIFLLVGVNDLLFGKSVDDLEIRYREIVEKIIARVPATKIILESILPVNNSVKNLGLQNAQIQALNARITRIAQDHALPFVDVYSALTDENGDLSPLYTEDGIHLNAAGYMVWKRELMPFFE